MPGFQIIGAAAAGIASLGFILSSEEATQKVILCMHNTKLMSTTAIALAWGAATEFAATQEGQWVVTNVPRAIVGAGLRVLEDMEDFRMHAGINFAHFTMLSGYMRLQVFGAGYEALLASEQGIGMAPITGAQRVRGHVVGEAADDQNDEVYVGSLPITIGPVVSGTPNALPTDDSTESTTEILGPNVQTITVTETNKVSWDKCDSRPVIAEGASVSGSSMEVHPYPQLDQLMPGSSMLSDEADLPTTRQSSCDRPPKRRRSWCKDVPDGREDAVKKPKRAHPPRFDPTPYIRNGKQYCTGVTADGNGCERSCNTTDKPYHCCGAHKKQWVNRREIQL